MVAGTDGSGGWSIPWRAESSPRAAIELAREVGPGHPLWQVSVRVLARRQDCDDVLFALDDGTGRVAVVHLTFQAERDPHWPATELFGDLADFLIRRMRPDHEAFAGG